MSSLKKDAKQRVAIISDAFSGILGDATRAALIEDKELEELLWLDDQLSILDSNINAE